MQNTTFITFTGEESRDKLLNKVLVRAASEEFDHFYVDSVDQSDPGPILDSLFFSSFSSKFVTAQLIVREAGSLPSDAKATVNQLIRRAQVRDIRVIITCADADIDYINHGLLFERACKIDCVNGQNRLKSQITGGTDGHDRRTARHFDERLQETRGLDWRERASETTH